MFRWVQRVIVVGVTSCSLATASILASPSVVPQPAAAISCSSAAPAAPVRVSGPAVKATGKVTCNQSVYNLQVRIRIYAKDCGTCPWYLFANSGFLNCYGCGTVQRSHQTFCSGTRQYFAHVDGYFSVNGTSYIFISGKSSPATSIAC